MKVSLTHTFLTAVIVATDAIRQYYGRVAASVEVRDINLNPRPLMDVNFEAHVQVRYRNGPIKEEKVFGCVQPYHGVRSGWFPREVSIRTVGRQTVTYEIGRYPWPCQPRCVEKK